MKSVLALLVVCLTGLNSFAQDTTVQIDFNNANATITNTGNFFNVDQTSMTGYEIPKGSGLNAMYTAAFWYAAENSLGDVFASFGGNGFSTDIDQGPYSSTGDYSDPSYDASFTVSICQSEIDQFNLWWECENGLGMPGCATITTPSPDVLNSIYSWPGNGDVALGQSSQLAPYFDRDGDGVYDPIGQGDYPIIKGCCATYMIQNDPGRLHTFSGTDPIGIEMHYLFYQYGANDMLFNTTFVDVMAINMSGTDYPTFSQGFYIDFDLGNYGDDHVGCDSLTNMMMLYNGDNNDESGYGIDPPALGVVALENPITAAVPYGNPVGWSVASAVYQMKGFKYDGSPWVHPDGYATPLAFSGNPNDPTVWSEVSEGNPTGDRRALMSTTYGQFNTGDTVKQSYAIIYSRIGNNLENAEHLSTLAQEAQAFHDSGDTDCAAGGFVGVPEEEAAKVSIYPNPNKGSFVIESSETQFQSLRIMDVTGKEVRFEKEENGMGLNITLPDARSGVYIISIQTEKGQIVERLIVE